MTEWRWPIKTVMHMPKLQNSQALEHRVKPLAKHVPNCLHPLAVKIRDIKLYNHIIIIIIIISPARWYSCHTLQTSFQFLQSICSSLTVITSCFRFHRWFCSHLMMPLTLRTGTFTHNSYLHQTGKMQMVVQFVAHSMFHISIQITNKHRSYGMMVMKLQSIQSRKLSFIILLCFFCTFSWKWSHHTSLLLLQKGNHFSSRNSDGKIFFLQKTEISFILSIAHILIPCSRYNNL